MDFTILLSPIVILILVIAVGYGFYSDQKSLRVLEWSAKRLGLSNLQRHWFSQITAEGKLNGLDVALEGSSLKNGIDLTLRLRLHTPTNIYIQSPRLLHNFDIGKLIAGDRPLKLGELIDKRFEVFTNDVLFAKRICYDARIAGLLEQCIQDQSDYLSINQSELVVKHLIFSPLYRKIDTEMIQLELTCIWKLIDSVSSLLNKVALNFESLICPFCRDRLIQDTLIQCEKCLAIFHEGCWDENGRQCAVFKCASVVGNILQSKN